MHFPPHSLNIIIINFYLNGDQTVKTNVIKKKMCKKKTNKKFKCAYIYIMRFEICEIVEFAFVCTL